MMNSTSRMPMATIAVLAAILPEPAAAYIGPGAGLGAIAVALALIVGFILLIVGLVWYPLKRRFKRSKNSAGNRDEGPES